MVEGSTEPSDNTLPKSFRNRELVCGIRFQALSPWLTWPFVCSFSLYCILNSSTKSEKIVHPSPSSNLPESSSELLCPLDCLCFLFPMFGPFEGQTFFFHENCSCIENVQIAWESSLENSLSLFFSSWNDKCPSDHKLTCSGVESFILSFSSILPLSHLIISILLSSQQISCWFVVLKKREKEG